MTKRIFKDLFKGSEIVIAGKIGTAFNSTKIEAIALDGPKLYDIAVSIKISLRHNVRTVIYRL